MFYCCWPDRAVEQRVDMQVNWEAMMLMCVIVTFHPPLTITNLLLLTPIVGPTAIPYSTPTTTGNTPSPISNQCWPHRHSIPKSHPIERTYLPLSFFFPIYCSSSHSHLRSLPSAFHHCRPHCHSISHPHPTLEITYLPLLILLHPTAVPSPTPTPTSGSLPSTFHPSSPHCRSIPHPYPHQW